MSIATGLKTIVVATDLDGRSDAALEYARKIAAAYGARVVLAYGLDPVDYAAVGKVPGAVLRELPEEARVVLDRMAADLLREGIYSHSEIRQGAVAKMLIDVARQYDAGLIIIGTEGRQGAGPVLVGTVAEQLVRLASCPGPVMLAMEKNEAAKAAASTAFSLAEKFQRSLIVVHARTAAEVSAFLNPCATTLEEFGIRPTAAVPVRCVVKDGKPADAIHDAIEQNQPSMLVFGVKRASETPGPHGTAFTLLAQSRVPVLCVPPETVPQAERGEMESVAAR